MDPPSDIATADDRLRRIVDVLRRQNDPGMLEAAEGIAAYRAGKVPTLEHALGVRPGPAEASPSPRRRLTLRRGFAASTISRNAREAVRTWPTPN